jgi:hypothetical protein
VCPISGAKHRAPTIETIGLPIFYEFINLGRGENAPSQKRPEKLRLNFLRSGIFQKGGAVRRIALGFFQGMSQGGENIR